MRIEAIGIEATLGGKQILHGVDIVANPGEFVGVIGPNGSGKSTLLKCLYRVLKPSAGKILIDGRDLADESHRNTAQKIAVVAQHNHVDFDFTVFELVMMGRSPYKRALDRDTADDVRIARSALQTVGMTEFENRVFHTLSGGERQRVILAQALAQQTPCLILDEPTNHLDIQHQFQLLDIVSSLKATVIAAIHDLNIAAKYCDKLYALQNGRVLKCGAPADVLTSCFIRDVFCVQSQLVHDSLGGFHILFISNSAG